MQNANTPGARIKTLRKERDMTQVSLAAEIGVSRAHVAKIETGGDLPGREALVAFATYFDVSLDWLSRGVGDMRPARAVNEDEALLLFAYRNMPADEAAWHLSGMLKRAKRDDA